MSTTYRIEQLEFCHREMFGDLVLTCPNSKVLEKKKNVEPIQPIPYRRSISGDVLLPRSGDSEKRRATALVDQLLFDIYKASQNSTDYNSCTSGKSNKSIWTNISDFESKDVSELHEIVSCLSLYVGRVGSVLVRQLKRRDALRRQQDSECDVITGQLEKRNQDQTDMRFTIQPGPGESGYSQWSAAMKMVAQLPGGIPPEFRKSLWISLADRHLAAQGMDWGAVERNCFSEWSHPTDSELGVQIVKDLHRTGCSLFCGEDGQENQALLKRVLLAYARWNKAVGYCQGFNMLAALILQVTEKNESEALKLMIYLIEGVLPDSYFADSLRGLSVDMAVFRELLRSRLPRLSKHLDTLQCAAKDGTTSYEPPLTNVFTMQWFLTLFCNCLPQPTVLRVWDLILLEGNEILLRTALAIWQTLSDKILGVRSADEFYCIMGVLTRDLLEFSLIDANSLIKAVVNIGPLTELKNLRDHYMYNINPWGSGLHQIAVEKQLKLYPRDRLVLDISALKKQYSKLKQRQRQAHIIFSAAISRQPPPATPVAMNHLLLGKRALVPAKRLGPPKGTIPPARQVTPSTLFWKDTKKQDSSSSDSSDTELCDNSDAKSDISDDENKDNQTTNKDNMKESVSNLTPSSSQIFSNNIDLNSDFEFNTASSSTLSIPLKTEPIDSEEENYEFEKFLKDRVKCLKEGSLSEEEIEKEETRLRFGRRNSERALQIIQENSLILHRILQCQTRLSPSPPLIDSSSQCSELVDVPEYEPSFQWDNADIKESTSVPEISANHDSQSPQYGSRYSSILEKSKSLDERYNTLILNHNIQKKTDESTSVIEESDEKYNNLSLNVPPVSDSDDKQTYEKYLFTPNLEENKSALPIHNFENTQIQEGNNLGVDDIAKYKEDKICLENKDELDLTNKAITYNLKSLEENQSKDDIIVENAINNIKIIKSNKDENSIKQENLFNLDDKITFKTENENNVLALKCDENIGKTVIKSSKVNIDKNIFINFKEENGLNNSIESDYSISFNTADFIKLNKEKEKLENFDIAESSNNEKCTIINQVVLPSLVSQNSITTDDMKEIVSPAASKKSKLLHQNYSIDLPDNIQEILNSRKSSPRRSNSTETKSTEEKEDMPWENVPLDKKYNFNPDYSSPNKNSYDKLYKDLELKFSTDLSKIIPETLEKSPSFYESSFSDSQKETFLRFNSLQLKESPTLGDFIDGKEIKSPTKVNLEDIFKNTENDACAITVSLDDNQFNKKLENNVSSVKSPINTRSILDEFRLSEEKTDNIEELRPEESASTCYNYLSSFSDKEDTTLRSTPTSPCKEELLFKKLSPPESISPSLRSPNKVFNPFPVTLSSRQNKEVPLKLGLYKK